MIRLLDVKMINETPDIAKKRVIKKLNEQIKNCKECRLSLTKEHAICGEGNLQACLMLVALSPGENENRQDKMFIGPSGQLLDELLDLSGISRNSLYLTNLIKCMLPNNRRPKKHEIETCSSYLDWEIDLIAPEVIVPLGFYATRYILTTYGADPPEARKGFRKLYGKLIFSENQKIFPLPHPSSLLYEPSFKPETVELYQKLVTLSQQCKWFPFCPIKRFVEENRLDAKWIELFCKRDWESCIRYGMEEKGIYHPDWMLPDGSIDLGLRK
jgi:uracil-DNA glycosylase family 4